MRSLSTRLQQWIFLAFAVLVILGFSYFVPQSRCDAKACMMEWCYYSSMCGSSCSCVKRGMDQKGVCYLVD